MKVIWTAILGIFSTLLGMFFVERNKRQKAEESNRSSEDKVLEYKQQEKQKSISTSEKELARLQEEHDKAIKENQKDLTPEEIEEYWRKRRDS